MGMEGLEVNFRDKERREVRTLGEMREESILEIGV